MAQCCVVSSTHGSALDAYVLSESSLFVYPSKLVIKTCGTTALLAALPHLLALVRAACRGAPAARVRYSRACFKYPAVQPAPHRSWAEEVAFLDRALGVRGSARVLGDGSVATLRWHVYAAAPAAKASPPRPAAPPVVTVEVCCTGLDKGAAGGFIFSPSKPKPSAAEVTVSTGIGAAFPGYVIDDFAFDPCGYSMNALRGGSAATIHVTPEAKCSYASLEISGPGDGAGSVAEVVGHAVRVFKPSRLCVALTVDGDAELLPPGWAAASLPPGFVPVGAQRMALPGGGYVMHVTGHTKKG